MTVSRVIVVGAGIGGLSAAVDLTRSGVQTTVLEQAATVGGKAHRTFVAGQPIDTGPTVFTLRSVFDDLFARAGYQLEDFVEVTALEVLARHFWRGSDSLDLFANIERSVEAIASFSSPKEAERYRKFAVSSEALFHALDKSFMRAQAPGPLAMVVNAGYRNTLTILRSVPFQTLWRALRRSFDDPRLQQLFARYSTYCGSSPFEAPATLSLIAHAERAGVWMLKDGMQSLAEALRTVVENKGGTVRCQCKVQRIECKENKIRGVVLDSGEFIEADVVIFNGDPGALHAGLLGTSANRAVRRMPQRTLSAVTLATVATTKGPDLSVHNVFFGEDYAAEFDSIFKHSTICNDPTLYLCAPDRTQQLDRDTPERLFCLMNAPACEMAPETVRREAQKIETTLLSHGLAFTPAETAPVVAHPILFNQRFPGSGGALYGQPTHGAFGSFTRSGARTTVRGLYLAGGGVHPGAGVPMVSLSGQLAAKCVLTDLS
jgi:1-hydroxycarotenoid 3,4-desaturase